MGQNQNHRGGENVSKMLMVRNITQPLKFNNLVDKVSEKAMQTISMKALITLWPASEKLISKAKQSLLGLKLSIKLVGKVNPITLSIGFILPNQRPLLFFENHFDSMATV